MIKDVWNIKFCVPDTENTITVTDREKTALLISFDEKSVRAEVYFSFKAKPLVLSCSADCRDEIVINCRKYKIEMYKNGILEDEEWCVGYCLTDEAVWDSDDVTVTYDEYKAEENIGYLTFTNIQGWKPDGHNVHVGDCMPFSTGGVFHLFYLFDRRGHGSKWGLGAHQWAHVSSDNLKNWSSHPMAVGIDKQEEGSICTGSIVYHNEKYYAFYAVRTNDGTPAKLTWSVSDDCVNFEKTGITFELDYPYHASSARDPKAFIGDDGKLHLLITTSIKINDEWKGCLAHVISSDPESNEWTALEPARILEIEDQPECSDYFFYGGLYYLIYSNFGTARYYVSENPYGPWRNPVDSEHDNVYDNIIVGNWYRVPKSAVFNDQIIFAGFIVDSDVGWGGTVRLFKAIQKDGGILEFEDI